MYFQRSVAGTLSSLITTINSHYPNFVSWGTPAGTPAHSERQSWPGLTRCLHKERKLVIQEITASWMSYVLSFLTNILCSMRSKAFLKTKRTTLTKAPLPSVTHVHQTHKQMKGSMSYSPTQMRSQNGWTGYSVFWMANTNQRMVGLQIVCDGLIWTVEWASDS